MTFVCVNWVTCDEHSAVSSVAVVEIVRFITASEEKEPVYCGNVNNELPHNLKSPKLRFYEQHFAAPLFVNCPCPRRNSFKQ